MSVHQVELYVVSAKDRRPSNEDIHYAAKTPQGFLSYSRKTGRSLINKPEQDLYVFQLRVPLGVEITEPDQLTDTLSYAPVIGVHYIEDVSRVKLIRCGRYRFQNKVEDVIVGGTEIPVYGRGVRIS